jgi:Tat protein secretion system quality control protein TatD with DNase activity
VWLPHIAKVVARARGETPDTLSQHTCAATWKFFGLEDQGSVS